MRNISNYLKTDYKKSLPMAEVQKGKTEEEAYAYKEEMRKKALGFNKPPFK